MRITFCSPGAKPGPWLEGLREALPGAVVEEWQPGAPPADHAVVWKPPQQLMDEQPGLKGIFNMGAGVDALLKLRLPPGAVVVRIDDGGMAVQMAEYVSYWLLRWFREFDAIGADIERGRWQFRKPQLHRDWPVGVMGLGVLGERVARSVAQFDFPVLGWSRTRKEIAGVRCFSGAGEFDEFLAGTRVLVCLLPLTSDTQDIMNARTLGRLRRGACVINVARGAHLVEQDLLALLDSGQLAGAALDVFRTEPLPAEHPFWQHPKIAITPHTSALTLRDESIAQITRKIQALERGEPVTGVVDPNRGY